MNVGLWNSDSPHSRLPITHFIVFPAQLIWPVLWEGEHGGTVWSNCMARRDLSVDPLS